MLLATLNRDKLSLSVDAAMARNDLPGVDAGPGLEAEGLDGCSDGLGAPHSPGGSVKRGVLPAGVAELRRGPRRAHYVGEEPRPRRQP